jgi:hypothetical protein
MKGKRFTEAQITYALRQAEGGTPVAEVCRQLGVSEASFYLWKKKCGKLGMTEIQSEIVGCQCKSRVSIVACSGAQQQRFFGALAAVFEGQLWRSHFGVMKLPLLANSVEKLLSKRCPRFLFASGGSRLPGPEG